MLGADMSVRRIIETFERWKSSGSPIVLATVFETLGSTYSKAGQRIVIADNGDFQGLVSGGCLEGDLAERARTVIATDRAGAVTYDLRDEADLVFGMGIGCNGLIRVLLQPLTAQTGYEPFATLSELMLGRARAATATVIESRDPSFEPGATLVCVSGRGRAARTFGAAVFDDVLRSRCEQVITTGKSERGTLAGGVDILYAPVPWVPRVLILGAGLDAVPLVNMAAELGWHTTICDHRPAYLERRDLGRADAAHAVDPRELSQQIDLAGFDAVLVMSHHLATDEAYLRQLADIDVRYIGVLGPRARRDRLLESLGAVAGGLRGHLRGPVGLDIGGDAPESIALSILAELQAVLSEKEARV
jgi:xanthine/CO dehydrogenase XdhC/CoxF family maturation factor